MAQQGKDGGGVPFTGLLVALALTLGVAWQNRELESTRPSGSDARRDTTQAPQNVPNRLWEDPFEPTTAASRNKDGSEKDEFNPRIAPAYAYEIQKDVETRRGGRMPHCVSLLPVLVFGGPYGEYAEVRRRTRYAVVSGLLRSGYAAADEDHIGYVHFSGEEGKTAGSLPRIVPFEWYRRSVKDAAGVDYSANPRCHEGENPGEHVLVLWVDEDAISAAPLRSLQRLALTFAAAHDIDRVRVIGPAGSTTLKAMSDDIGAHENLGLDRPFWINGAALEIYAWGVTIPSGQLLGPGKGTGSADNALAAKFADHGISLFRTHVDDRKVIKALGDELAERRVELGKHPIAIVYESETFYGRQLLDTITKEVGGRWKLEVDECRKKHPERKDADCEPKLKPEELVIPFNYFRGLDGETATPKNGQRDRKKDEKAMSRGQLEASSGQAQLDYTRRVARAIRERHERLREADSGINAIGIFGTDFYDKSILLQALKKEMPHADFFTTDLDARMTDSQHTPWSRSLLVASGLGLSLRPELQRGVAPFRDGYQTATYLSTLLALNVRSAPAEPSAAPDKDGNKDNVEDKDKDIKAASRIVRFLESRLAPRTYEVGTHQIFDYGWKGGIQKSDACALAALLECATLYPEPSPSVQLLGTHNLLWAFAILLGGLGLLVGTSHFVRDVIGKAWNLRTCLPVLTGLVTIGVLTAIYLIWWADVREPFRWAEGFSAWPTMLLRFVALVLAVCFLYLLMRDHEDMKKALDHFQIKAGDPATTGASIPWWVYGVRDWFRRDPAGRKPPLWSVYRWARTAPKLENDKIEARCVATEYRQLAAPKRRVDRVLPVFLSYFALCLGLVFLWDMPNAPIRGMPTFLFHVIVLALYIVAFGVLLFAVVDAVRLFEVFVQKLMKKETAYEDEPLNHQYEQLGLPDRATIDETLNAQPEGTNPAKKSFPYRNTIDRYVADWIDIQFVARKTESTIRLVYLPFIVLAIALAARSRVFENWHTPPSLLFIFVLAAFYSAYATIGLRRTAEKARSKTIDSMTQQLIGLRGRPDVPETVVKPLETMIEQVKALNTGALMPLAQQPVLKAVLLPISTFGGVEVLQYLVLMQ